MEPGVTVHCPFSSSALVQRSSSTLLLDTTGGALLLLNLMMKLLEESTTLLEEMSGLELLETTGPLLDIKTAEELRESEVEDRTSPDDDRRSAPELEDKTTPELDTMLESEDDDNPKRSTAEELDSTVSSSMESLASKLLLKASEDSLSHSPLATHFSRATRTESSGNLSNFSNARMSSFSAHSRLPLPQAQKNKPARIGRYIYKCLFFIVAPPLI
jgi:hypothetical protein